MPDDHPCGFAKSEQVHDLNKSEAWDLKERES